jgi:hypothetical protein
VSERLDPPKDPSPSPTDDTPVECADDKSPSQPVPKEPPVDSPAIEDSPNVSIAAPAPGMMVQAAAASVIGFCRLSVEPPSAVAVAEQELQAASPTAVATLAARCYRPALIQVLANHVIPPCAPPPAAEADEISVVMVNQYQGTLDRGQRTQTRATSRATTSLSLASSSPLLLCPWNHSQLHQREHSFLLLLLWGNLLMPLMVARDSLAP